MRSKPHRILLASWPRRTATRNFLKTANAAGFSTTTFFRKYRPHPLHRAMRASIYNNTYQNDINFPAVAAAFAFNKNLCASPRLLNTNSAFYGRLRRIAADAENAFLSSRPHAVIIYHGFTPLALIMLAKAKKFRVPTLFLESSIIPNGAFILDTHAPYFAPQLNSMHQNWPPPPLTDSQRRKTRQFIATWQAQRKSKYSTPERRAEQQRVRQFLTADPRPVLLFALQAPGDMNVNLGLPPAYGPNYAQWIQDVLRSCPQQWKVIIKPHPRNPFLPTLPARNMIIAQNLNLHDFLKHADAVITLSSNVGLEAILAGKPLITAGQPYYGGKGLSLDMQSPDQIGARLQKAASWKTPEKLREQFIHYALIDFHFHHGETDKLSHRIRQAIDKNQHPDLIKNLPDYYHDYTKRILKYNRQRSQGHTHAAILAQWRQSPQPHIPLPLSPTERALCALRRALPKTLRGTRA